MIYELINPSDQISFEADEHRIAICCVMMVGDGAYGAEAIGDKEKDIPLMLYADVDRYLRTWFGEDAPVDYMQANKATTAKCLRSFLYGKPEDRAKNMLVGNLEESQDKLRSSINDIRGKALKIAELLMTTP